MLNNQTVTLLRAMKLSAMASEFMRQQETLSMDALDFTERFGMLVDAEWRSRENNRVQKLTSAAKMRITGACFADIDYRPTRKLDKSNMARLLDFAWIREHRNIILTGATGTGKTWMSCAFGTEACRGGYSVAFYRVSRLLGEMNLASESGTLLKLLAKLKRIDVLILDDWGLSVLSPLEGRLLLEVFEDRYNEGSCIISAQLPVAKWHDMFADATLADAVLDRIVNNAYRIELHGPSMRANVITAEAGGGEGGA
jgi:DNA replication protein DnaC